MKLSVLFYLLSTAVCFAQLDWKTENIEVKTTPDQKSISGSYTFTNTGKTTIEIVKIATSCGCTTAELKKRRYEPGESGDIKAVLTMPPENPGDVIKYVYVKTDEKNAKLKKLRIMAKRPKYLIFDNRYIKWKHKDEPVEKFINIEVEEGYKMTIAKLESSNPDFKVSLITVEKGKKYKISVKPPHTKKPIRTMLRVITDYPEKKPLVFTLSARVAISHPF